MATKTTTDATFELDVLTGSKPAIVDFWAVWCGPCRAIAPVLEEISNEYADKIDVYKLNTDENPQVTAAKGITSIPTMHVYKDGKLVKSLVGAMPKPKLIRELDEFLR